MSGRAGDPGAAQPGAAQPGAGGAARALAGLGAGLLFGLGLVVSRMANPAGVRAFLDVAGAWDPSLAFVMGGAVAVTGIGFRLLGARPRPLMAARMIDRHLVGRAVVVVLAGTVRVEQIGSGGPSIVLYRVGPGDSCVMATSVLLSGAPCGARGVAEGSVEVLALPARVFRALTDSDADFRARLLSVVPDRILELSEVIDDLLVRRVDLRLAAWLVERSAGA